jgi:hypothetical protein
MEDKIIDALNKITDILLYLDDQHLTTYEQRQTQSYVRFQKNLQDLRDNVEVINVLKRDY